MRLFSLTALAFALFSLTPEADAQTAAVVPYMTVDAVEARLSPSYPNVSIVVTGVVDGQSTPSTRLYTPSSSSEATRLWAFDACHRSLLLALGKPGQYHARIDLNTCVVALIAP
jgi:hypothetical protein